ncbi:U32 family peptidase [Collinsella sp. An307]|uniref:U32 family peptidase n=1 Tax=Collinsella sp. An307 TaxID=1965630 RepID=UPI00117CE873|nr:U32 family peptidase [Collinsella sp. An307]
MDEVLAAKGTAPTRLPELLAPAGSAEALLAAIAAGADAVYTGLAEPGLDARAAAPGLTWEELERACAYGAAHGVLVYVTLNALVRSGEEGRVLAAARRAQDAGASALIVADLGLARLLAEELPGMELHLSTQAGAQAAPAVAFAARELGCARVTVARELSVAEIVDIVSTGVACEVFCHGAICISYSGACSLSAAARGRSAMRGDCTQPCRQSWRLVDGAGEDCAQAAGDKLLCPKDFLGLRMLPELIRAGVSALKIEGRMKNPDYVFNVVGAYHAALDALAAGEPFDADALVRRAGTSFNRGFTDVYLRGDAAGTGRDLMSFERSCNQGIEVGVVVARARHEVTVELTGPVRPGDTLEIHTILPADAGAGVPRRFPLIPCTVSGEPSERVTLRCKRRVEVGSAVFLTASAAVLEASARAVDALRGEVLGAASCAAGDGPRRLPPRAGEPPLATSPENGIPPRAGADPAQSCEVLGAPVSSPVFVASPDAASSLLAASAAEVAVEAWRLLDDAHAWEPLLPRLTVLLDACCRASDLSRTRRLMSTARRVICRNLTQLALAREAGVAFDAAAPLYAENPAAVRTLQSWGAKRVWLPDELPADDARRLGETMSAVPLGTLAPGERELMVMEHCILTAEGPCDHRCAACGRRREPRFLLGKNGDRFAVRTDALGRSRVLSCSGDAPRVVSARSASDPCPRGEDRCSC